MFHPHIHCIVPSGGLSNLGNKWNNSKENFFIPVKVLSRKFLAYFKEAFKTQEFVLNKDILQFTNSKSYSRFLNGMYAKEWIVYSKAPYKSASHVLKYLGRYTHRVAISNDRILNIKEDKITFKWRDYRDNNKEKIMVLSSDEFIRRFITHILPPAFVKIRHYGINSNINAKYY
ncbi:putative transposase [Clostridium puniceum]|uniref:Putative transposase n=2 Tax=Clostridium puniceum TaxID=29367 RepID=A0A1S8TW10_9CLOT|nr:transposase [Clostridium puniceum]OOM81943.1 putative transposase [Clostridium puniceum]